jgi:arsenite-transporting ATPase
VKLALFGGKGGVGKTTCAAASAVAQADGGRRVLAISTDPAHSLGDALERKLGAEPRRVPTRRGELWACELDADRALARFLDERRPELRALLERGTYLDGEDIERFLSLSLPGVDELIGLSEVTRLADARDWDAVLVDTAPTGHTLRLFGMPEAMAQLAMLFDEMQEKHRVLQESLVGRSAHDGVDTLVEELDRDARALHARLRDPARAGVTWVTLAEPLPLSETLDGVRALAAAGIPVDGLVINRLTPAPDGKCALCDGRRAIEARTLEEIRAQLAHLPRTMYEAMEREPRGVDRLRRLAPMQSSAGKPARAPSTRPTASKLRLEIAPSLRVLLFGGKGGVGKTTCAAAAAVALSARRRVLLLSTDPAHSLADVFGVEIGDRERELAPSLWARELDAEKTLARLRERYREAVDALFDRLRGGSRFDASYDRAIARDLIDLSPPGIDELFALAGLDDALDRYPLVIVDTAPTGHTLRLLALPQVATEWVHALLKLLVKYRVGMDRLGEDLLAAAKALKRLSQLFADGARARFVAVTRPGELPALETARLIERLDELRMARSALLVNDVTPPGCRRCDAAHRSERSQIARLGRAARGSAILLAPALVPPPTGAGALGSFAATWERA